MAADRSRSRRKRIDYRHRDTSGTETHHNQTEERAGHNDQHTQARTPGFLRQHGVGDMTRSTEPETDAEANKHSS